MYDIETDTPQLDYRLIPVPNRAPVVLLGIEVAEPAKRRITLVLDFSDSCTTIEKQVDLLRKLFKELPSSWPFDVYRLSSPESIGKQNLTILDFLECKDVVVDLCTESSALHDCRGMGSFLRPCVEDLYLQLGPNAAEKCCLVFVLSDGDFTDFGHLEVPASLDIVAITAGNPSAKQKTTHTGIIPSFHVMDRRIDSVLKRHRRPFFGPVKIEMLGTTIDPQSVYRVEPDGRLTQWSRIANPIFNLAAGRCNILLDADLTIAANQRWKIRSLATSSELILSAVSATTKLDLGLEKRIAAQFTLEKNDDSIIYLFRFSKDSESFHLACDAFTDARRLTEGSLEWATEEGRLNVFQSPLLVPFCSREGIPNCDAMVAVQTTNSTTNEASEVMAIGLYRTRNPALRLAAGDKIGDLVATKEFSISFDSKLYRWILTVCGESSYELEHYTSEPITLPIVHPKYEATTIFSGNLR